MFREIVIIMVRSCLDIDQTLAGGQPLVVSSWLYIEIYRQQRSKLPAVPSSAIQERAVL
jgi:hypothetical protein